MAKSSTFRFSVAAAAVFVLILSLPGCGGGGGSDPASVTPPVTDTTPPYVLANQVTPTPGTTIPRSALIMTVKFSETLACPSGIQPLSVKANTGTTLAGNYTCVGDLVTATVTTASLQDANLRSVEFELSGFADLAGNKMAAPYIWSYPVAVLPPPPVTHAHGGVNLLMRNYTLHRVTTSGLLPNTNKTPWQFYAAVINLVPRADCLYRVSVLDNSDSGEHKVLYSMATGEMFPDTSADGAALDRNQDYVYETVYDPTDHPEWRVKLSRPEGVYYSPDLESWALYFKGLDGAVIDLTPGAAQLVTGIVQGMWHVPACSVSAN